MSRADKLKMYSDRFKKCSNPEILLGVLSVFYIILMFVIANIEI
jgi:hypothetical protein